jgi:hypothetical protein
MSNLRPSGAIVDSTINETPVVLFVQVVCWMGFVCWKVVVYSTLSVGFFFVLLISGP